MTIRRSLLPACAIALALSLPAAVSAAPTAVDVRIEGKTSTIFDAPVTTDGKTITTASGGTHVCDGTNLAASPVPVANATSALDDAATKGGFGWDGTWSGPGYPDFYITRIADETEINAFIVDITESDTFLTYDSTGIAIAKEIGADGRSVAAPRACESLPR